MPFLVWLVVVGTLESFCAHRLALAGKLKAVAAATALPQRNRREEQEKEQR